MILPELKQKKTCDASLVSNLDKKKKKVDFPVKTLSIFRDHKILLIID